MSATGIGGSAGLWVLGCAPGDERGCASVGHAFRPWECWARPVYDLG